MGDVSESERRDEDDHVENSPKGRYVRYQQKLGTGAYKTVYKAYDTVEGIEVAWNDVSIALLPKGEKSRVISEIKLLESLQHPNIISFYSSWFNREKEKVVFITELMTSGTLNQFVKKRPIRWRIIKRWAKQILEGMVYLHNHDPPIIHRDLKCDNIFINGGGGDIRIGDLGLSTTMQAGARAQSVLGTPEFMAPELYDENYDEKVDIYAFGMCLLEMITKDVPYLECQNAAQIYKKVSSGIMPAALNRVTHSGAAHFIGMCLRKAPENRPSASQLLEDPFLIEDEVTDAELVEVERIDRPPTVMEEPELSEQEMLDQTELLGDESRVTRPAPQNSPHTNGAGGPGGPGGARKRPSVAGGAIAPPPVEQVAGGVPRRRPTVGTGPTPVGEGGGGGGGGRVRVNGDPLGDPDDAGEEEEVVLESSEADTSRVTVLNGRDSEGETRNTQPAPVTTPAPVPSTVSTPAPAIVAAVVKDTAVPAVVVLASAAAATETSPVDGTTAGAVATTTDEALPLVPPTLLQQQSVAPDGMKRKKKYEYIAGIECAGREAATNDIKFVLRTMVGDKHQDVNFAFDVKDDTAADIADEMVSELHLPDSAKPEISAAIEGLVVLCLEEEQKKEDEAGSATPPVLSRVASDSGAEAGAAATATAGAGSQATEYTTPASVPVVQAPVIQRVVSQDDNAAAVYAQQQAALEAAEGDAEAAKKAAALADADFLAQAQANAVAAAEALAAAQAKVAAASGVEVTVAISGEEVLVAAGLGVASEEDARRFTERQERLEKDLRIMTAAFEKRSRNLEQSICDAESAHQLEVEKHARRMEDFEKKRARLIEERNDRERELQDIFDVEVAEMRTGQVNTVGEDVGVITPGAMTIDAPSGTIGGPLTPTGGGSFKPPSGVGVVSAGGVPVAGGVGGGGGLGVARRNRASIAVSNLSEVGGVDSGAPSSATLATDDGSVSAPKREKGMSGVWKKSPEEKEAERQAKMNEMAEEKKLKKEKAQKDAAASENRILVNFDLN